MLASIGRRFHAETRLPLGALGCEQPKQTLLPETPGVDEIAVVGAHLSRMPLNHELKNLGARFLDATTTAPDYRLYALAGTEPRKPGLLRVANGSGFSIEVEIWALPTTTFGQFVAAVPPPLLIGTLELADHRTVKGFLVEGQAVAGARATSQVLGAGALLQAVRKIELISYLPSSIERVRTKALFAPLIGGVSHVGAKHCH